MIQARAAAPEIERPGVSIGEVMRRAARAAGVEETVDAALNGDDDDEPLGEQGFIDAMAETFDAEEQDE